MTVTVTDNIYIYIAGGIPSGKLTWQWKMDHFKMYFLFKMVIFHCHISLLEGRSNLTSNTYPPSRSLYSCSYLAKEGGYKREANSTGNEPARELTRPIVASFGCTILSPRLFFGGKTLR